MNFGIKRTKVALYSKIKRVDLDDIGEHERYEHAYRRRHHKKHAGFKIGK